jgi:glycosyltransferase involved in cell wall biosynthesis
MNDKFKRTVIIFGPEIWSLQEHGGISRYCFELISELNLAGANVRAILGPNKNAFSNKLDPSIVIKLKNGSKSEVSQGISSALKEFEFGIYHATYFDVRNLSIAKRKGLRTVVTVHDLIGELFPEKIKWYQRRNRAQELASKSCDLVIADSENTKADLEWIYGLSPDKIRVVHLGTRTLNESPSVNPPSFSPYVLHVGNRDGYKNFLFTVEAIAKSNELAALRIIAFGGGEFSREEISFIDELGMTSRILQCAGSDEVLASLYRHSVALVYPSLYEGFGIPPLEAMRLGCPVIASNRASIPEICGDVVFFVDPTSVATLQRKVIRLLESPESYPRAKAYEHSLKFTWEKTARESLSVYDSIIESH